MLKRALEREKEARLQAERMWKTKSAELNRSNKQLRQANSQLENMLAQKIIGLDAEFLNIIDPYVVMDLKYNVLRMNASAKEFLGFDHTKEKINLSKLVHKDYLEYTAQTIRRFYKVGTVTNYRAKIITKRKEEKWVEINGSLIYDDQGKPIAAQGILRDITEEILVKQMLIEQTKQLDSIVHNSPLGIVLTRKDQIVKSNPSFSTLIGYAEEELKNMEFRQLGFEGDPSAIDFSLRLKKSKENNVSYSSIFRKKDGSSLNARINISWFRNENGVEEFKVILVEDIAKELRAKEQLKASEQRLSTLISNLQMGVLLENEDRKISLTNSMFCDLFSITKTPEQLIGVDCGKAAQHSKSYFKDSELFIARIEEILRERKVVISDELEMVNGKILERDYIPIFNDEYYRGHLWTYQDVTLQRKYKQNLEQQREKYSSIIANMNLGLVEVDNEDIIQMVNQSFCNMSGYSHQELIGKQAGKMVQVSDPEMIAHRSESRLNGISDSYEVQIVTKQGEKRHWLISGAPRYDESGKVIGSIGIHLDITQQKDLELQKEALLRKLETSNKELQEYAHIVSHDLKSPLRSISSLATWLYEDYANVLDEEGKQNLEHMQEKVSRMDRLISGILQYSMTNSAVLNDTAVDLNKIIEGIKETIFIPDHVTLSIPEKLPTIFADGTKVYQLFQNIITNAVSHIEKEKGLVEVLFKEAKNHWQFTVKDNGVGIPKEYHQKIFNIFQSIGNKERSTGIGLSIVKKIVDRYEGKVWIDSEVGVGTDFHFTLKKEICKRKNNK